MTRSGQRTMGHRPAPQERLYRRCGPLHPLTLWNRSGTVTAPLRDAQVNPRVLSLTKGSAGSSVVPQIGHGTLRLGGQMSSAPDCTFGRFRPSCAVDCTETSPESAPHFTALFPHVNPPHQTDRTDPTALLSGCSPKAAGRVSMRRQPPDARYPRRSVLHGYPVGNRPHTHL